MSKEADLDFKGFSKETIQFLKDLKENNDKRWFNIHKDEYTGFVLTPFRKFVSTIAPHMLMIDPLLEVSPACGKTISRIYRDTRFSRNKSPFKTAMWSTFKRSRKDWKDTPAFFFEVSTDLYRYGMGFFEPERATMEKFRDYMDYDRANFLKAVKSFEKQESFELYGEMYKRPLKPDLPERIYNWYQRKEVYFMCQKKISKRLFSPELINDIVNDFIAIVPVYNYMWKVKGN